MKNMKNKEKEITISYTNSKGKLEHVIKNIPINNFDFTLNKILKDGIKIEIQNYIVLIPSHRIFEIRIEKDKTLEI